MPPAGERPGKAVPKKGDWEMDRKLRELFDKLLENRVRRAVALTLAIVVTFTTTYSLVLPAITLEKDNESVF